MARPPTILFDGVCNLCNAAVLWVIRHDPEAVFKLASLQSQAARELLGDAQVDLPDSIVLVDDDGVHTRSDAAIRIARRLGRPWLMARTGWVPRFIRDSVYNLVARHRYRLFGKRESCMVPTPELRSRFLDDGDVLG